MDERTRERWLDVATGIFAATSEGFVGAFRSTCERAIARHEATGRLGPDAWTTAGSDAMRHQSGGKASDRGAAQVRAIQSGLAVVTGDMSAIPAADRAELAEIVRRARSVPDAGELADAILAAPAPPALPSLAAPVAVEAAIPCFTGAGSGTAWLGRHEVMVSNVDAVDAPVACRLPTASGGVLDLRMHQGQYYRPVLAPGSWEPLDVAGFAEAAKGNVPWVDSPFVQGDVLGRTAAAVVDCAVDVGVTTPARRAAVAAAAALAARRHGDFLAVDGIVYRKTGEPSLTVRCDGDFTPDGKRHELVVAWALHDDLVATDDLRTLSRTRTTGLPFRFGLGLPGDKVAVARLWEAGTFAVVDAAYAREFAASLADLGPTCGKTSPFTVDVSRLDDFAVEVVDPSLLPSGSPHPWLDATMALLRDLDAVGVRYEGGGPDAIPRSALARISEALDGHLALDEVGQALADAVSGLSPTDPAVDTARLMAAICGPAAREAAELDGPNFATFVP